MLGYRQATNDGRIGQGDMDEQMREICAEILGRNIARVKMTKPFLAQGGDSLLAIKLMARWRSVGYDLSISDILQSDSLGHLCKSLMPLEGNQVVSQTSGVSTTVTSDQGSTSCTSTSSSVAADEHTVELEDLTLELLKHITTNPNQDIQAVFPCSAIQEAFLISQSIDPSLYQCTAVVKLEAVDEQQPLNYARIQEAWREVTLHHEALRTVFIDDPIRKSRFRQVVMNESIAPLKFIDGIDGNGSDLVTEKLLGRQRVVFETYEATHRATLCKLSPMSALFKLEISHALLDGESFHLILQHLSRSYRDGMLRSTTMHYVDFVSHENNLPKDLSIAYWSRYLAEAKPSFFPTNGDSLSRTELKSVKANICPDPELVEGVCSRFNISIANLCQVAWALILRSYVGQEEVCFSFVSSARHAPVAGISNTVGAFIDTTICRVDLSEGNTLGKVLAKTKDDFIRSLPHPGSFMATSDAHSSLFSSLRGNTLMSCMPKLPKVLVDGAGLSFEMIDSLNVSDYDLTLNILTDGCSLEVVLDYWEPRIDHSMAATILSSFQEAFETMISQDVPLGLIDVVPVSHVAQIQKWNGNVPCKMETLVQQRVTEQCHLQPSNLAVQSWDGDLTYQQLEDESNKLACHLQRLGVDCEVKVPLCFHKSKWAVISQLAILKAGACVVPIGPNQPRKRVEMILKDVNASIVLTSEGLQQDLKGLAQVIVVNEALLSAIPSHGALRCPASPDNLAFIIYTSGSTGVPKGVMLPHSSLCISLHYLGSKFRMGPNTRTIQFSAYTFDISIQDIYTTWHFGGCLCIPSEDERINWLGPTMDRYRINYAGLTSTVAATLSPDEVPTLDTLVLLGEAVKQDVVNRWINHVSVFNAYGPSECSMQASCCQLTPTCDALNIGRALAGALWVVDAASYHRLVPIGAPGELLIEGPLQARGYLNDEAKTAAAFVTDAAWAVNHGLGTSKRLYRTGDLVRQNGDGSITYIGRRDTQIKFRGHRLEVGEIEHHLLQHDEVLEAAVVCPVQGPCKGQLVGFLCMLGIANRHRLDRSSTMPVSTERLVDARHRIKSVFQHLGKVMPEHLIPTVWIPLEGMLPQNDSSKLDRKQLGQWVDEIDASLYQSLVSSSGEQGSTEPSNLFEKQVQDAWSNALRTPANQISVQGRSFLSLGGDSITAMKVISHLRSEGIIVSVRDVVQSSSIADLIQRAGVASGDTNQSINEPSQDQFIALSLAQQWHLKYIAPRGSESHVREYPPFNQSVHLKLLKIVEEGKVADSIRSLVTRHPMLRARFKAPKAGMDQYQYTVDDLQGSYSFGSSEVADWGEVKNAARAIQADIDLENGPVFASRLLSFEINNTIQQTIILTAPRLLIDLPSWNIILRDLEDLLCSGIEPSTQVSTPFTTFTRVQKELGEQPTSKTSSVRLGIPAVNLKAWGLEACSNTHHDQTTKEVALNSTHTRKLLGKANDAFRTKPVEILMVAVLISYAKVFPNHRSPSILTECHERECDGMGLSFIDTVGQLSTMMPVDVEIEDSGSNLEALENLKDSYRAAERLWPANQVTFPALDTNTMADIFFNFLPGNQRNESKRKAFDEEYLLSSDIDSTGGRISRPALFNIEATVQQDKLRVVFGFNKHMSQKSRVNRWAEIMMDSLQELISDVSTAKPSLNASDFPLANMWPESFGRLKNSVLPAAGISLQDVEDVILCSPIQQGILISQARWPSIYHIRYLFEIQFTDALRKLHPHDVLNAWQALINRHSILRTIFVTSVGGSKDGEFVQIVLKSSKACSVHKALKDEDVKSAVESQNCEAFEAAGNSPRHTFSVYSSPSGRIYGHLVISHALVDATSLMLLQSELLDACDGVLSSCSEKGPLYKSYISYLQRFPPDGSLLEYWVSRLADAQPCYLPALTATGMPAPTLARGLPRYTESVATEFQGVRELQLFSDAVGVTMANIFQLAWALVLSKYTGSNDVSFGYLSSGRDAPVYRVQELIGPLINIMVTRIVVDPESTVQQALQQVQDDFLEGFGRQRASLTDISHKLNLKSQTLFNTCLSYRHSDLDQGKKRNLVVDPISSQDPTEYDVNVHVVVSSDSITVNLQYWPEYICREASNRLSKCLLQAVQSLMRNGLKSMTGKISVLPDSDAQQLRVWNEQIPKTNTTQCIHELFHAQSVVRPMAQAVCAWDGDFTYRELNGLADLIAGHLRAEFQVGPEKRVLLCFDKSRWAVVSQLAVLKAGGVVVSINPKHPMQRNEVILNDIQADIILTTRQHSTLFANYPMGVLHVDSDLVSSLTEVRRTPDSIAAPDNAAFIIYTSGSTGLPKGVVLTHSSLTSSFEAHGKAFGINHESRTIQFASYTFDASISDIWATLSTGGCVCVISEDERMNNFEDAIRSYNSNIAMITPTVAGLLNLKDLPSLRTIVLGGEEVKPALIEELVKAPHVTVFSGYGPTECSIYTTCSGRLEDPRQGSIIGRPLLGGCWVVEDGGGALCPIGAVGELWVEGPLLARGYLNDISKTESSFVNHPTWAQNASVKGHRFYRTGDLVRLAPDGHLFYLGRRDAQIKIRGQRVELGEIEYQVKKCLTRVDNVIAGLVTAGSKSDEHAIAVAIELQDELMSEMDCETAPSVSEFLLKSSSRVRTVFNQLHTDIGEALPFYMSPTFYFPVSKLPLTSSGKIDRRMAFLQLGKLSDKELTNYRLSDVSKVEPATETETRLQSMWAAVLEVDLSQIGANDNFFKSGGDSLTAMRLVARINKSDLELCLSVADVFQFPKLAEMARYVDKRADTFGSTGQRPVDDEIPRFSLWKDVQSFTGSEMSTKLAQVAAQCRVSVDDIEDVYPCTPLQEGLMAITAQQPSAYIGRWAYKIPENIDLSRFKACWQKLVSTLPILRTRIVPGELSGALQVVVREGLVWGGSSDLDEYLLSDGKDTMSYGSPLLRLAITVTESQKEKYFVITAHHSVYDGWSLSKIHEALSELYETDAAPVSTPFTRFIRHVEQQDQLAAESFWKSQLDGDFGTPFPLRRQDSNQDASFETMTCRMEFETLQGHMTLASILRAAWSLVVSSHVGDNVLFAMPVTGRNASVPGIMDVIAPTLATLPVRIRINPEQSIHDFLDSVHQQSIDMMPFEQAGLQNIRRWVQHAFVEPSHIFVVQPAKEHSDYPSKGSLSLEPVDIGAPMQLGDYALSVECVVGSKDENSVLVNAQFDSHTISNFQTGNMLQRFKHLFQQLVDNCNQTVTGAKSEKCRLQDLEMVSPGELALISKWNRDIPVRSEVLVHDLIKKHAECQPERPAICSWDGNLSHAELNEASERVAHNLVSLGVGPESMIPVCFEKSVWAVISMLAILKAGGAVVPIITDPIQRMRLILQNVKAKIVLTSAQYASHFHGEASISHVLCIDRSYLDSLPLRIERAEQKVGPNNAAFVIHTSGSTGTPKGVVVEHAAMATGVLSQGQVFGMDGDTRSFQFSAFTFDASVHDIFATLVCGGCVCIPSEEERVNDTAGAMSRMRVSHSLLTPRVLHTIKPTDVPHLRTLVVGGEAVQAEHVDPWVNHTRVFNAYGPTECSIMATAGEIQGVGHTPGIGSAVAGALWVVDEKDYNKLVPIGTVGELLIEGPLLARGYLNDLEKTSAAFIEDPEWLDHHHLRSGGKRGRRMYRTGDLVIQNQDGSLLYMGRTDNQVKVRGHRIDVADVEHHLMQHEAVEDVIVLYPRVGPCRMRLTCLLTLQNFPSELVKKNNSDIWPVSEVNESYALEEAVESIRQRVQQCVTGYMLPDVYIPIYSMPLNSSNKVDRKMMMQWLESIEEDYFEKVICNRAGEDVQEPTNLREKSILEAIQGVLGLPREKVSLNRSFLSMGGDSISAMQLVSWCRAKCKISLVVRDILQSTSIAQLAQKATIDEPVTSNEEVESAGVPFDLSPIQRLYFQDLVALESDSSGEDRFNQSACLVAQGSIKTEVVEHAVEAVVTSHPMLRARFQFNEQESRWQQTIEADIPGSFHFGVHKVETAKMAENIISSGQRRLHIERGPVFSADWIHIEKEDRCILFIAAHHLVVDLVSWRIIIRDLEALMAAKTPLIPEENISFRSWTRLQASHVLECRWSTQEVLPIKTPLESWDYWGITPETNVFGDRISHRFSLDESITSGMLSGRSPSLRAEPNEMIIAALIHSFNAIFPSHVAPTVFSEGHGREPWLDSIDLSNTVGWFTTLTPIHVADRLDDVFEMLKRAKDVVRSIPENGSTYFASRFLDPQTHPEFASHARPEIVFNYGGRFQQLENSENVLSLERSFDQPHLSGVGNNVRRLAVFEVEASVWENKLVIQLGYSKKMKHQDATRRWAQCFESSLKSLLQRLCTSPVTFSLSDFPSLTMTYDALARLEAEILLRTGIKSLDRVEDIYPCSPIQQGILLSRIKNPESYQLHQIFQLKLPRNLQVDPNAVSEAWRAVVCRHSILRTIFTQLGSSGERFLQIVLKRVDLVVPTRHCDEPSDVVPTFIKDGRPKYVNGQPNHRLEICTTRKGGTYAQFHCSHVLLDASAVGCIFGDLIKAYNERSSLPPAPSYSTYVNFLRKTPAKRSLDYWKHRLEGSIPCHLPRSIHTESDSMSIKTVRASLDDMGQINSFRDNHGVTVATIVQLAWALVLSKYTGSSDILFGYLVNGRDAPIEGVNDIAGPMMSMMVSRISLETAPATPAWQTAQSVQNEFLESLNHSGSSLGDIQHELGLSGQNLFDTVLSVNHPLDELTPDDGLTLESVFSEDPTEYGVSLNVLLCSGNSMKLSLHYSSSVLDGDIATFMLDSFAHTISSIATKGHDAISSLGVLGLSEVERIMLWDEKLPVVDQSYVQARISQQTKLRPNAPAICTKEEFLTYSRLDELSNNLASYLIDVGVGPESMVGLCFEKSASCLVAMLAVLRAGGVIVPLGIQLPSKRLGIIVDELKPTAVLASKAMEIKFKELAVHCLVSIDSSFLSSLPNDKSHELIHPNLTPSSAAVVIYTSGSTGRPKGVVLTHGALFDSLESHGSRFGWDIGTRTLQYSAYVFDVSLSDTLGTLQHGGCVCVVSEEERMDIGALMNAMTSMRVNFAMLTPTVADLLEPSRLPTMKTLGLAGEPATLGVVRKWLPFAEVLNCYGPAECTIFSTFSGPIRDERLFASIGVPSLGKIWVVSPNDYNNLVPIGAVGELLIEGPLLARGYFKDTEKTEAAFIYNPSFANDCYLGSKKQRRMYRTGDLVRQSPDGSVTLIGREDGQIKIRGQRVEVGDIEACVRTATSAVTIAAVTLVKCLGSGSGISILAVGMEFKDGYGAGDVDTLVLNSEPYLALTPTLRQGLVELQVNLSHELPLFMVPTLFVPLRRMPLTASGKVDRKTLRAMFEELDERQVSSYSLNDERTVNSEPLTDRQLSIQTLWTKALNLDLSSANRLGPMSHFFRSGGDSVTAMRLVALAADADPPLALSVDQVFKNPVLKDMASVIDVSHNVACSPRADPSSVGLWAGIAITEPSSAALSRLALHLGFKEDDIEDFYPCTPLQKGLMSLTGRQPAAYINRWAFRLRNDINLADFKAAWQSVIDAEPILRSRIVEDQLLGTIQVVMRNGSDWIESSAGLDSYVARDESQTMHYGTPLMRFAMVSNASSERIFVWTAHHSVYDGWSILKILRAVSGAYYHHYVPDFTPFKSFICYAQQANHSERTRDYWVSQLDGASSPGFPTTSNYQKPSSSRTLQRTVNLLSSASSTTTATLLRSAWALVLSVQSGSSDVVFATTLSGRSAPVSGILDTVGPTIATVPVRIRLDSNQSVESYLTTVQQQAIDMAPYEHVGLQNIRSMVPSTSMNLQHLFVVSPSSAADDTEEIFPGLTPVHLTTHGFLSYPLVMECMTAVGGSKDSVNLRASFDENVLHPEKVISVLDQFEHALTQLQDTRAGDHLVGDVSLLTPKDIDKLREWNPPCQLPAQKCIHEVIHRKQLALPDSQAVNSWDGSFSYSELCNLASRLAQRLMNLGVGPETCVAIAFEKTKWAVVAQLAILMAGGAVVPINPKHPTERIQHIISATQANIVLVPSHHRGRYEQLFSQELVVDQQTLDLLPRPSSTPNRDVRAENSAFIMFTSGSTGIPKGVVLEHQTIVSSLLAIGTKLNYSQPRVLQFATLTFDASLCEIFGTLIHGGTVCIPSQEGRLNDLSRSIGSLGVDTAILTVSVANLIKAEDVPFLEKLVFVGEPLSSETVKGWEASNIELWNGYGPTECSIMCSFAGPLNDEWKSSNVGIPLPGTNVWVVEPNNHNQLVPVGSLGELLIEGPLVGRGYLNDDAKTANSFVTNPEWLKHFESESYHKRRFYRTGDLVRQELDGSITVVGRQDGQLKINGQRVDVGEIEQCIKKTLPDIHDVSVDLINISNSGSSGNAESGRFLVATVQMQHSDPTTPPKLMPLSEDQKRCFARLRASLLNFLPSYMIPQIVIPLTRFSLTDSGKLDRRAVKKLQLSSDLTDYLPGQSKIPPSTETEIIVQRLWSECLGISIDSIGATDDFFSLGGDSISAMRLVVQAREQNQTFTVADIFRNPQLSDLAALTGLQSNGRRRDMAPEYAAFANLGGSLLAQSITTTLSSQLAETWDIVDAAYTTDFQSDCVLSSLQSSRDMLAYAKLDGIGACDVARWRESCSQLVRSHDILRTAYVYHQERLIQVVLSNYEPELQLFETDQNIEDLTKSLMARDMLRTPRLGKPFTEFAIVTSSIEERHRIIFRLSHGEYDGISLGYFINNLGEIYNRKSSPERYPSFCQYLYSLPSQEDDESLRYYRQLLKGARMPVIEDPSKPKSSNGSRLIVHGTKTVQLTKDLPTGITLATIVRAAWALTLAAYTNSSDVLFGEVVSGRNTGDRIAEKAAGCCANVVPVRALLSKDSTILGLMQYLRDQQLSRLPYETLGARQTLQACPSLSTSTRFTSIINYLDHVPSWTVKMGELNYDVSVALPDNAGSPANVSITSFSRSGALEIALGYSEGIITPQLAKRFLEGLQRTSDELINGRHDAALGLLLDKLREQ